MTGITSTVFMTQSERAQACGGCGSEASLNFRFTYAYQPIVDLHTRSVFAHEALVRGPEGQGADTVLAQVDDQNRYRFDQACRVKAIKGAAQLGLSGNAELLSINFLPNAIYKPEVCIRTTLEAARTHGFPVSKIIFEATEGEKITSGAWLAEVMREYQRIGFLTAIDDFGAGYAGLNLLADFQPDFVKIDMHLTRNIQASKPRQAILKSSLSMCEELGITVIVEGIETEAERDYLRDLGIRYMQGYLFARPALNALQPVDWSEKMTAAIA